MKLIADNLRITKPDIQEALNRQDPEPIQALASKCADEKPFAIDVNTGPLSRNHEQGMQLFIKAVESVTDLPLVIDTSNPEAMKAGLEAAANPTIINGYSLEEKKLEGILPLAKDHDCDIIGFILDSESRVPNDETGRLQIAMELFEQAEKYGVPADRIIIDPVIPPLAWEDGILQVRAVLAFFKALPDLLGFNVRTIAGVSNLTTGAVDKKSKNLIDTTYLAMLAGAGLDYALLDIFNTDLVHTAKAAHILSSETLFSWGMVPSD